MARFIARFIARIIVPLALLPLIAFAEPNYQGCQTDRARSFPYCNATLSIDERVADLIGVPYNAQRTCHSRAPPASQVGLTFRRRSR
jgi:hypothetical protein